jgi:hypothetical protein
MNPESFFGELKRRNVIRMTGLYLVGAWLVVQVDVRREELIVLAIVIA